MIYKQRQREKLMLNCKEHCENLTAGVFAEHNARCAKPQRQRIPDKYYLLFLESKKKSLFQCLTESKQNNNNNVIYCYSSCSRRINHQHDEAKADARHNRHANAVFACSSEFFVVARRFALFAAKRRHCANARQCLIAPSLVRTKF